MSARTKARKRAMDILFAADLRDADTAEILADEQRRSEAEPARETSWRYAREIVTGVQEHRSEIDELISTSSRDWSLERMPRVDRAILRVAIWELRFNDEVPAGVAINEALEAAKQYSTDDSARFINGVLGRISDRAVDAD